MKSHGHAGMSTQKFFQSSASTLDEDVGTQTEVSCDQLAVQESVLHPVRSHFEWLYSHFTPETPLYAQWNITDLHLNFATTDEEESSINYMDYLRRLFEYVQGLTLDAKELNLSRLF